jgi:triacylglycerol esterase/lipase EstA (alpha/beta hydrolase family)
MKLGLRDLVVVLPGITGSVLEREGRTIWAPTHRSAARAGLRPGSAVADLALRDGDEDAVAAVAVMPDAHMVGGLVKIDGYSRVLQSIERNFLVVRGQAANLIEFPYDWRLDNRMNAARLRDLVAGALHRWREHAEAPDAQVVLVAHSMGGLIARYFLEVLGGWRDCRALITFGTPFRGSPAAVGYLANGYKKLHIDLTSAMRSFPSVYQLMPIYPALRTAAGYRRIGESDGLPNIDAAKAADALRFHREIEAAVAGNLRAGGRRYAVLPVIGTHQPTHQSATLDGGLVTLSPRLPEGVDRFLATDGVDGDGTVPICSATPIELSDNYSDVYLAGKHSSLQTSEHVLGDLVGKLSKMQAQRLAKLRGPDTGAALRQAALAVTVDDEFHPDEPIEVRAALVAGAASLDEVYADITCLATGEQHQVPLKDSAGDWSVTLGPLAAGTYRCTVTALGGGDVPTPVSDLFQVAAP